MAATLNFQDIYEIPGVGYTINRFLNIRDDTKLDTTNNVIRKIHRESVYPLYTHYNVDGLYENIGSEKGVKEYLRKVSPYAKTIRMKRNEPSVKIASIRTLPNLEEMTFAVPMILDTTLAMIHPHTTRIWAELAMFVQSLQEYPNKLRSLHIVPGIIRIVRVNMNDFDEYLEDEILEDKTEGSHLAIMHRFGFPVLFSNFFPKRQGYCVLEELKVPYRLLSLAAKNTLDSDIKLINWDFLSRGIFSGILDLLTHN
jgi:hypothetical protein